MCRKPSSSATVIGALTSCVALAVAVPVGAWPLSAAKPPAPAPAPPAAPTSPRASPQERIAAERLDPLARSAFWVREANLDPTDTEAGIKLAATLRQLGRYTQAGDAVGRVLVLYPADLEALLEAARIQVADGKGFYALEPLRKAQAASPRDWRVYSLLAVAHDQNRQPDAARAAYDQALALSPDNPAVLSNLGLWYASHGHAVQGEGYLRRAVAQAAATAQERQNLALVLGMEGKLTEAENLMREDLPPEVADANMAYLRTVAHGRAATPAGVL